MSKIIICLVDASLNWYFLYTVRKRLVKYHGLKKYASLVRFNFRLMAVSISLDVGLPFLTPHPPSPPGAKPLIALRATTSPFISPMNA